MTNKTESIDQALLEDDELSITLTRKSRKGYMQEQKIRLMKQIGVAQSVLLLQKTPKNEIRKRKLNPNNPNSPSFDYVEHAYVSETLNFATLLDWDLVVDKTERLDGEVIVEGHIIVRLPSGKVVTKYGTGGAKRIINNQNQTWADVYNSATSKMLKVAAARLGLGLDLYRHEEKDQEEIVSTKQITIATDDDEPATDQMIETLQKLGLAIMSAEVTRGAYRRAIQDMGRKK